MGSESLVGIPLGIPHLHGKITFTHRSTGMVQTQHRALTYPGTALSTPKGLGGGAGTEAAGEKHDGLLLERTRVPSKSVP